MILTFSSFSGSPDDETRAVGILKLLPFLLKQGGYKSSGGAADRVESQRFFIFNCSSLGEADKHFNNLISSRQKILLQPIIVTISDNELGLTIDKAYIFIEGKRVFDFDSVIDAVHFCMLLIWYFNFNYQEEARNIWPLIQMLFYKFGDPETLPCPSLVTHYAVTNACVNKPFSQADN